MTVVIDTNVLVVANGASPQADLQCQYACNQALEAARAQGVAIDDAQRILSEYRAYCSHSGQPGLGDAFFRWLWNQQGNPQKCHSVPITPHGVRGFEEFPDDPRLGTFDRSDRKFVAVALAAGNQPPILNATDSDWWQVRAVLAECDVHIEFVCPQCMPG
ncbi:MAG TPA: hypothetical protein VEA40_03280 [Ramlibacter sp.]|nr:hypothetical protein [Ramlibacter sp.]